jgi:two-component system, cell cycle sensor histidine kinase and response regulator CckA
MTGGEDTIVVVDDEPESLGLLMGILTEEGYRVRPADTGELALVSVAAEPPKLILLDIRMSGMDGFEVCRRIKAREESRQIPLMFISAATEVEERVEGLALGAVDFVCKPFRREELLARVRTHLELGGLRAQLEMQVEQRTAELRAAVEQLQLEVAERQCTEIALRESEERFRVMADTAPVMIWVSGPDKLCTFFNKVWLDFTGRTMEQESGEGWAKGVHPDDLDRCIATYSESFHTRRSFQMEYRLRRNDGEYRSVLDHGVPRLTPGGIFTGYIGSCVDITEVKHAQEEALASQRLESVGQLARGIAHDFNNLLSGILATAEFGLAERAEGASPEEELLTIRTAAIRGAEIVRQLMTYGGEERPDLEPIDLALLINEMLQLLKVSISKNVILETDLGEGLPAVQGSQSQIRQVVMNLITNASEAIGERNGLIRVATMRVSVGLDTTITGAANLRPGDYLKLEVSDTGSGMTPEVQTRIFDPFFTTKSTGHGLGLAAVQGIVRSHFGAINVVSSLGRGTRFEILLPCTDQPIQLIRGTVAQSLAAEVARATGTVLVIEDEDTLRLAVSKMLRKNGLSVIEAIDGSTAVDLFRANESDITVVLLDMTLPKMSGPAVFAELLRIRPDVMVILTTAYGQETPLPIVGGQPAWAFIRKPYKLKDLVNLISAACLQNRGMSSHTASGLPAS